MARLYLFAEGQTEQTFASDVLAPHLANHGVYLDRVMLIAHGRKKGKVLRGGGRNFQPMQNDILRFLKQESGNDVFFTTMIDLYALSKDFPGSEDAEGRRNDPYGRVEFLENAWSECTDDTRFIPYIQLHEYEAILFTDVDKLERFFDNSTRKIGALREIADSKSSPELINDGQHTAPSKRIIAQFPQYEGLKVTTGVQAAKNHRPA